MLTQIFKKSSLTLIAIILFGAIAVPVASARETNASIVDQVAVFKKMLPMKVADGISVVNANFDSASRTFYYTMTVDKSMLFSKESEPKLKAIFVKASCQDPFQRTLIDKGINVETKLLGPADEQKSFKVTRSDCKSVALAEKTVDAQYINKVVNLVQKSLPLDLGNGMRQTSFTFNEPGKEIQSVISTTLNLNEFTPNERVLFVKEVKKELVKNFCNTGYSVKILRSGVSFNYVIEFGEDSGKESLIVSKSDCKNI